MMTCVYLFHSAGKQRVWNVVLRNTKAAMQQFSVERGCCNARELAAAAAVERHGSEVPQQRLGEDALWRIIARRDLCLSDWDLLRAIAAHCRSSALPLAQWALHVDFARMAPHQVLFPCRWIQEQVPVQHAVHHDVPQSEIELWRMLRSRRSASTPSQQRICYGE